jgi:hypothetical protein
MSRENVDALRAVYDEWGKGKKPPDLPSVRGFEHDPACRR